MSLVLINCLCIEAQKGVYAQHQHLHRTYHAAPSVCTSQGTPVNTPTHTPTHTHTHTHNPPTYLYYLLWKCHTRHFVYSNISQKSPAAVSVYGTCIYPPRRRQPTVLFFWGQLQLYTLSNMVLSPLCPHLFSPIREHIPNRHLSSATRAVLSHAATLPFHLPAPQVINKFVHISYFDDRPFLKCVHPGHQLNSAYSSR